MIIAVDFDGTLEEKGAPNYLLISELRARQARAVAMLGADPRKIYADVYIDDKNVSMIRPTQ